MRHECFFLPALEDVIPTVINDLQRHIISSRASTPKALVNEVLSFHQDIHRTHHCFPEVHNLLKFYMYFAAAGSVRLTREHFLYKLRDALKEWKQQKERVVHRALKYIPRRSVILVAGADDLVEAVVHAAAAKKHIHTLVVADNTLHTHTSSSLISMHGKGLTPMHYPSHLLSNALKHADLVLTGCAAITPSAVVAPQGVDTVVHTAASLHVPTYVIARSWKFTHHNHMEAARGRTTPLFAVLPKSIKILSEYGMFSHHQLVEELAHHQPWL